MTKAELSRHAKYGLAICVIALPLVVFFLLLLKTAVDLPILDDYQNVLGIANVLQQEPHFASRLMTVFTSEHNGYKLWLENAVVWMQLSTIGHVSILPLVYLGDALSLLIFISVAAMAKFRTYQGIERVVLLVPVIYFICQLQYASALNFASSSLQHLAVVAFSMLTIYLMTRGEVVTFAAALIGAALAVSSSPNGFFLAPVGILYLAQQRAYARLVVWLLLVGGLLGLYMYYYVPGVSSVTPAGHSGGLTSHPIHLLYALSFLGSSAARYAAVLPSIFLGLCLVAVLILATMRRYDRENPAVFYSMLFIAINAFAVSALRPDADVAQSLASRYRTYSNLMLALSYVFAVESIGPKLLHLRSRRFAFAAAASFSMSFCFISDYAGARFLLAKKAALITAYRREWLTTTNTADKGAGLDGTANPVLRKQINDGVYDVDLRTMRESRSLGTYHPPLNP